MSVKVDFLMPDLKAKLIQRQSELLRTVAAVAQTNRAMLFDSEGRHNGRSGWAPLKFRVGMILSNRGTLRKSIGPSNDGVNPARGPDGILDMAGDRVTIGTRLFYASMMNDGTTKFPGGVLRPRNAKALKIPLPSGKSATQGAKGLRKGASGKGNEKFIFRKSVRIPARPFNDWNEMDQREMTEALAMHVVRILNR
jgi:phage gpG-like protein